MRNVAMQRVLVQKTRHSRSAARLNGEAVDSTSPLYIFHASHTFRASSMLRYEWGIQKGQGSAWMFPTVMMRLHMVKNVELLV